MGQLSRRHLALYAELDEALARAATEEEEAKVIAEYIRIEKFDVNDTRYFDYASLPFQPFGAGLWKPPEEK